MTHEFLLSPAPAPAPALLLPWSILFQRTPHIHFLYVLTKQVHIHNICSIKTVFHKQNMSKLIVSRNIFKQNVFNMNYYSPRKLFNIPSKYLWILKHTTYFEQVNKKQAAPLKYVTNFCRDQFPLRGVHFIAFSRDLRLLVNFWIHEVYSITNGKLREQQFLPLLKVIWLHRCCNLLRGCFNSPKGLQLNS